MSFGLKLMVGNGEGEMNPGQMGINKETGLKNGSCYGQRGGGWGWRNAIAATSGQITCLISQYVSSIGGGLSAAWHEVEYTLRWCFRGMRIKCPALLKNPLLTNQVARWHRGDDPARRSSVLTWPCMRVLVVEPEIDWRASTRAMESLAIPFEQPAQSDWAIHKGKHRFLKPAYANCINRLNPSQVEMHWKGTDKETEQEEKKNKRLCFKQQIIKNQQKDTQSFCTMQSFCRHDYEACCKLPSYPSKQYEIFTPSFAHFRVTLTSSGVNKNTGIMTAGHKWEIICSWSNFIRKLIVSDTGLALLRWYG